MRTSDSLRRPWRITSCPAANGMRCVNPSSASVSPSCTFSAMASRSDTMCDMQSRHVRRIASVRADARAGSLTCHHDGTRCADLSKRRLTFLRRVVILMGRRSIFEAIDPAQKKLSIGATVGGSAARAVENGIRRRIRIQIKDLGACAVIPGAQQNPAVAADWKLAREIRRRVRAAEADCADDFAVHHDLQMLHRDDRTQETLVLKFACAVRHGELGAWRLAV